MVMDLFVVEYIHVRTRDADGRQGYADVDVPRRQTSRDEALREPRGVEDRLVTRRDRNGDGGRIGGGRRHGRRGCETEKEFSMEETSSFTEHVSTEDWAVG